MQNKILILFYFFFKQTTYYKYNKNGVQNFGHHFLYLII